MGRSIPIKQYKRRLNPSFVNIHFYEAGSKSSMIIKQWVIPWVTLLHLSLSYSLLLSLCHDHSLSRTLHQALKWLQTMPSADWSDRQSRWSQLFLQFGGMIEYLPGKHNPVADAPSRKSGTVQSAQRTTILDSSALDSMKEDYLDSTEFGTPYSLAMAGELSHFSLQDGWLLYKGRLCITASHRAVLLHDAHDSLVGGQWGINNTMEKLEKVEEGCLQLCAEMPGLSESEEYPSEISGTTSTIADSRRSFSGHFYGFRWTPSSLSSKQKHHVLQHCSSC